MKTFSLATRVDHATKKQFVDKASTLGLTLSEYLAYYLENCLLHEEKIEQLQAEKEALEEQNLQLQQALSQAQQVQAAKSKIQQHVERIMQQNDEILEQHFQQNLTVLKKDQLKQKGFNFGFSTCCTSNESSNMVHTIYNYGYSLPEEQVQIHRMIPRENL